MHSVDVCLGFQDFVKNNPVPGEGLGQGSKRASTAWKALSADRKAEFEVQFKEQFAKYERDFKDWAEAHPELHEEYVELKKGVFRARKTVRDRDVGAK